MNAITLLQTRSNEGFSRKVAVWMEKNQDSLWREFQPDLATDWVWGSGRKRKPKELWLFIISDWEDKGTLIEKWLSEDVDKVNQFSFGPFQSFNIFIMQISKHKQK